MKPQLESVSTQLITYLKDSLIEEGTVFDELSPLKSLGLDSFGFLELILFLERTFSSPFPLSALTPEASQTVRSLSAAYIDAAFR